jgi:hypothetical protein
MVIRGGCFNSGSKTLHNDIYFRTMKIPLLLVQMYELPHAYGAGYSTQRAYTCQHYSPAFISKVYGTVSTKLLPHAIRLPTSHCC